MHNWIRIDPLPLSYLFTKKGTKSLLHHFIQNANECKILTITQQDRLGG